MGEWVVLELSSQGEEEDPDILRASLSRTLKGAEIFIPASISIVGESRVVHKLIDNYVFVRRSQPDGYYLKVENTKYVTSVLTVPSGKVRKISTVRDSDIEKMRRQIHVETEQGIEVDDEVEVMSGAYRGIRGKVIGEIKENDSVQVYIHLRSKQAIVTLPRSFLRFVASEEQPEGPSFAPFLTKAMRIQEWARRASPLLDLRGGDVPLLEKSFSTYVLLKRSVGLGSAISYGRAFVEVCMPERHEERILELLDMAKFLRDAELTKQRISSSLFALEEQLRRLENSGG